MSDGTLRERLRAIPLFAEIDDAGVNRIAELVTEVEVPAGQVLVERGQPGSGMFLIEDGRVSVEVPTGAIELGPGEFFGELAVLADGVVRTARVRSATPVRFLAISRADVGALLEREPAIAVSMLPVLARRLADAESGS